jgi:hypothetical protein
MPVPNLFNERWQLDSPPDGLGSLSLAGEGFTHNGAVQIVYDYGGGQYERFVQASQFGGFAVTESFLYCGDIPGMPGVGVIVTAYDINTGMYATRKYSTPC